MNKFLLSANIVIMLLLLSACNGKSKSSFDVSDGDTIDIRYAQNITITSLKDYYVATLRNPWDTTKILHRYILVDKNVDLPTNIPEGTLVRTPISKAIVYSSVHMSLFNELGAFNSIAGVSDLKYINLENIKEACKKGTIINIGDGMSPDIEKIIDLNPDALLLSPFENSGGYGKVEKLGIPIIECADYMETSALGRAEWMKFYGLLTGKLAQADSIFTLVEQRYQSLSNKALKTKYKPTVFTELKSSSTWYVPGGNSTMAKILYDAGANYIFSNNNSSGSVPLSFESVFEKGEKADFWINSKSRLFIAFTVQKPRNSGTPFYGYTPGDPLDRWCSRQYDYIYTNSTRFQPNADKNIRLRGAQSLCGSRGRASTWARRIARFSSIKTFSASIRESNGVAM